MRGYPKGAADCLPGYRARISGSGGLLPQQVPVPHGGGHRKRGQNDHQGDDRAGAQRPVRDDEDAGQSKQPRRPAQDAADPGRDYPGGSRRDGHESFWRNFRPDPLCQARCSRHHQYRGGAHRISWQPGRHFKGKDGNNRGNEAGFAAHSQRGRRPACRSGLPADEKDLLRHRQRKL